MNKKKGKTSWLNKFSLFRQILKSVHKYQTQGHERTGMRTLKRNSNQDKTERYQEGNVRKVNLCCSPL